MAYSKRNSWHRRTNNVVKHPYGYRDLIMTEGWETQYRIAGERIRLYRETHNLSRQQLSSLVEKCAENVGIRFTVRDIEGYENRRVSPKTEKLYALCRATGLYPSFFCGYKPLDVSHGANRKAA